MAQVAQGVAGMSLAVVKVEFDRPWAWLTAGWQDLRRAPKASLAYGVMFAFTGWLLTLGLFWLDAIYLTLPLIAGFMIMGPLLAVGLYEISRLLAAGRTPELGGALAAWRRNPSQIALMGVALLLFLFAWIEIAALLFMLYFGLEPPSFTNLFAETFLTVQSLPFLVIGTVIGGVLASLVFAISAISIPLLLDRPEANVMTAIATSFTAVRANIPAMLLWAALIAVFVGVGLATLYVGLVVTLPLIGHATWHAYLDMTGQTAAAPSTD